MNRPETAPRGRPATIYDVAELAGVAPSTVSRTFARPGRVNADTAERVRKAAAELGYRSKALTSPATATPTRTIGLVVSDLTNPFYSEIIRGAQIGASAAGYVVMLLDGRESDVREREALERALPAVEGIIVGSSRMSDSTLRIIGKQKPMVVVNRDLTGVSSVATDNRRGARHALAHLAELGHERVTYVAGPEASWADSIRWRAVHDAGTALGLRTRRRGPVPPTIEGGRAIAADLAVDPPSAVIAHNDLVAIGLMFELADQGVRIPRDMSVIGFDNILPARLVTPGLTTVASPLRTLGETALRNLLAIIGGAHPQEKGPFLLPARLVVRGSTAPPHP